MSRQHEPIYRLAHSEASALGHDHVGTAHLLLALSRQANTVAAIALASNGVKYDQLRAAVVRIVKTAQNPTATRVNTLLAKKVLELAIEEARCLSHDSVGPGHLLLGLLQVDTGAALRAILELGADAGAIRDSVIREMGQG
jgi:ATP-dependent Clp protease ATP-binding subunit ClpC